jgi:hypothetical protein
MSPGRTISISNPRLIRYLESSCISVGFSTLGVVCARGEWDRTFISATQPLSIAFGGVAQAPLAWIFHDEETGVDMRYKIEPIGAQFSNKDLPKLVQLFTDRAADGYRLHSVFHVSQPGCPGLGAFTNTYLAAYVNETAESRSPDLLT